MLRQPPRGSGGWPGLHPFLREGPAEDQGTIDIALGKLNEERGWWQKPDPNGLPSRTNWKVLGRGDGLTWLAVIGAIVGLIRWLM